MLSPDARTVAIDLLRPPSGYRLDRAVLTTYSLDLEALLALPLAVLAHAEGGVEELLADPLLLLEALREAGERVHVFVDEGGIAIPAAARALYAMLEPSVHPVRARNGGVFHPKVWVARFLDEAEAPLLRVAVLSRNLTFDRSWDVALVSEGVPKGERRVSGSRPLGGLLRALPELAVLKIPEPLIAALGTLADQTERTSFPSPEGFDDSIAFHALGLTSGPRRPWRPRAEGGRLLAVAPFANRTALDELTQITQGERTLVSRQETLDALPDDVLAAWSSVLVLSDTAADEAEDSQSGRPSGLHAKVIAMEHGWDVTWFVGSANLTAAAFTGRNVELMASVTGRKGRKGGERGSGIDRFQESGFLTLCEPYRRGILKPEVLSLAEARSRLEETRRELLAGNMRIVCATDGESWKWTLKGKVVVPEGIEIHMWPITLAEERAQLLQLPSEWSLPTAYLTAFVAFRLRASGVELDDLRLTLKLPAEGMPESRLAQVLRTLIDSPERFLRFLRALLGGLDSLIAWSTGDRGGQQGRWGAGLGGETLLEDLVRVASRDPARLDPVRRLIADLRETEEGRQIVPDDLYAMWRVVDEAIRPQETR